MLNQLKRVQKFIKCYFEKQRALKEVWYLDERSLSDIGVSRYELINSIKHSKCII